MKYLIIYPKNCVTNYKRFETFKELNDFADDILYKPNFKIEFAGSIYYKYNYELVPKEG